MLEATTISPVETTKAPETLESPLSDAIQVEVLKEIGDVIVAPGSISKDNAVGISKCLIRDDNLRKRMIQEIKKRVFVGRAVTDQDFEVIKDDDEFRMTTLFKLMTPTAELNRLHLIDGLSVQRVDGEEKIAINIRQTNGKAEMSFDSINGRVLADILKVVLFDEDGEVTDKII